MKKGVILWGKTYSEASNILSRVWGLQPLHDLRPCSWGDQSLWCVLSVWVRKCYRYFMSLRVYWCECYDGCRFSVWCVL